MATPEERADALAAKDRASFTGDSLASPVTWDQFLTFSRALFVGFFTLQDRANAIEQRQANWTYKGVWKDTEFYQCGNFVTFGGSIWHANAATHSKPGADRDWTLAVKHGKDAR